MGKVKKCTNEKNTINEIPELLKEIRDIIGQMNISKAVIIDDKVDENVDFEIILDILNGAFDDVEFDIKEELNKVSLELSEVEEKARNNECDEVVLDICLKALNGQKSMFCSEVNALTSVVEEIFGKENTTAYKTTSAIQENGLGVDTILFLDYKLDGKSPHMSQDLIKVLSEKSCQKGPKCIIFISKDPVFFIDEKHFFMMNPIEKSKYFREVKRLQAEKNYKNSLYDFISKSILENEIETYKAIFQALRNLQGGKIFFELLEIIDNVLSESSQKVLDKFYLLNARSLQEVLNSKVENEGLAKPTFLMEWISRNIAKTVTRNDTIIKEIFYKLKGIGESENFVNEFHEDITLREIIKNEMWDTSINKRHDPIDFGDVFRIECNGVNRRAILMTQPCTLAVRKSGNRAAKTGMLILEKEKDKRPKNQANESPRDIKLNSWDDNDENNEIVFSLDDTITLSLDLLDLTTLDSEGYAIITAKNKGNEIELPEAFWAEGYHKRMTSLTKKLKSTAEGRKYNVDFGFMPIGHSWVDYRITIADERIQYSFSIKRELRLDYQYAMHLFQKAQSWWGRIGLPVELDFTDEYKPVLGNIILNGKNMSIHVFEKCSSNGNDVLDICIDLQELCGLVKDMYKGSSEFSYLIEEVFSSNKIVKYNCASGKRLLSLMELEDLRYFDINGIYIKLCRDKKNDTNNWLVVAMFPYFTKCYVNNDDATAKINNIRFSSDGKLNCNMPFELIKESNDIEEFNLLSTDKNKIIDFNEEELKDKFEIHIDEDKLYITEYGKQYEDNKKVAAADSQNNELV